MSEARCIKHSSVVPEFKGKTWCGKDAVGWCFQSLDHAAYNNINQGSIECCYECLSNAVVALESDCGPYEPIFQPESAPPSD